MTTEMLDLEPASAPGEASPAPPDDQPTPPSRDAALDLLRMVALARVVIWHTLAATWLTIFAAMPLMFFVAGSLLGSSLDGRSYASVLRRRARRVLIPLWVYGAVVAAVGAFQAHIDGSPLTIYPLGLVRALTWFVPLVDPVDSDWHAGWLSGHLWYLRAYLWLVVLAPVLAALARRLALALPIFVLLIVQLEVMQSLDAGILADGQARVVVGDVITYGLFAVLGMAYRSRRKALQPALLAVGAAACAGGAVAYAVTAGLPDGDVNSSYPAIALTGLAWLLAAGAAEGPLRRFAERPTLRRTTSAISRRAVTIYLWHPAAIVVAYALLDGSTSSPEGYALVLTPLLTALAVLAVGFVEDLAAGRPLQSLPRLSWPSLRGAVFAPSVVAVLAVTMPILAEPFVAVPAVALVPSPPASSVASLRPPSYRAPLASSDFAGNGAQVDTRPIDLENGRMPARQLKRALDRWREAHPEVGAVAVALRVDGKEWTGLSSRADAQPPPRPVEAREAVLSLSKLFTATLVLQAAEYHLINLDAPMPRFVGVPVPRHARGITPRQLLTHTSGLVDYRNARGYDPRAFFTPQQAVAMSLQTPLLSPPGAAVRYSSTNYLYLGLLLEAATGRPYHELVHEQLVAPLRLSSVRVNHETHPGWVRHAAGGVEGSLVDMSRFLDALLTPNRLLPRHRIAQLTTLGPHGLGLGTWPLCPCWTDRAGKKRYSAIGHHVGHGGLYHDPAGMTFAVRLQPASQHTLAQVESLHQHLATVFRL